MKDIKFEGSVFPTTWIQKYPKLKDFLESGKVNNILSGENQEAKLTELHGMVFPIEKVKKDK